MSSDSDIDADVKPTIFREYIGMEDNIDDFPANMINDNIKEFHFILGFATELYVYGKGTGEFNRTWSIENFSPENVAKLKQLHRQVKVVISIGGNGHEYQFNPQNNEDWITNAVSSIKEIILDYENEVMDDDNIIDGIDINYENITSSVDDFSNCIGQVIQKLKEDPDVSKSMKIVSIAPTELLQPHYLKLYLVNKDNIDWIDYKFYNQYFSSRDEFVSLFKKLVTDYDTEFKLLAGVSTYTGIPSESQGLIVDGCKYLLSRASLAGVFVLDANASAPAYSLERQLQELLTKE
ncbi:chitinase 2-like [Vicia villosa]|uniref:chitinase 2-like n=1 Tax=Vicia villosa TaxID=3911 RepID=UPI00273BCA5A|nr:chitinase 2-like [Vicia villosa]